MDIRNSLEGLKSLLGVNPADSSPVKKSTSVSSASMETASDRATLSNASDQVARTASEPSVRTDKVFAIQVALSAGSYNVPTSEVASRVVDSLLGESR